MTNMGYASSIHPVYPYELIEFKQLKMLSTVSQVATWNVPGTNVQAMLPQV